MSHQRSTNPGRLARVIVSALSLGLAAEAHAQQGLLGPGAAYFGMGVAHIATGDLDDRLALQNYPTFGQGATVVGIGAYRTLSSGLMLGGEFNGLIIGEKPHATNEVGIGGGYATLGVGYSVELSPRARVYPRFGFGAGGMGLWIEPAGDTVDFNDVLANPAPDEGRHPVLSRDGVVFDLGGGAEFLPRGGFLIGLRLGYLATAFGSASNWQVYNGTASNGPSASIAGPYIRVVIGGAWKH